MYETQNLWVSELAERISFLIYVMTQNRCDYLKQLWLLKTVQNNTCLLQYSIESYLITSKVNKITFTEAIVGIFAYFFSCQDKKMDGSLSLVWNWSQDEISIRRDLIGRGLKSNYNQFKDNRGLLDDWIHFLVKERLLSQVKYIKSLQKLLVRQEVFRTCSYSLSCWD